MYASDLLHPSKTLQQKLEALYALRGSSEIALGFRPAYLKLLEAFGAPHHNLPPVIHVAGTNGKGSCIAMMRSVLEAMGLRVHVYTSPHLVRFNERIVLAGAPITDTALEALIDEALRLNGSETVTFFEITTAMAFAAFARTPADIVLLETGLGGRLDCTNVVEKPLACLITAIGLDHMEFLGSTHTQIAAEKAGIMKAGVSCVIGPQSERQEDLLHVFQSLGHMRGSAVYQHGADWFIDQAAAAQTPSYVLRTGTDRLSFPAPALAGAHQIGNAGSALFTLWLIRDQLPELDAQTIRRGLTQVRWPARLQNISASFPAFAERGWEIWLDGGHNPQAAQSLAAQARHWRAGDGKHLHLIAGMMAHKDPAEFLKPLAREAQSLSLTAIAGEPKALAAQDLAQAAQGINTPGGTPVYADWRAALGSVLSVHAAPGRILICGSLYLAGAVLRALEDAPEISPLETASDYNA